MALLALIVLALMVPARGVLLPAWPHAVEEILTQTDPDRIERVFLPAGSARHGNAALVARSRPLTLWRLETVSGEVSHVWLAGIRDGDGQLLPALPHWLEPVRLDGPLPGPVRLVVVTATRATQEIEGESIVRMYRPNDMTLIDRLVLWRDRLDERWQWPFRATADARMTPPPR